MKKSQLAGKFLLTSTIDCIQSIKPLSKLILLFSFIIPFMVSEIAAQTTVDFNFQIWIKTTSTDSVFLPIATNKYWIPYDIVDFTSNHNYGQSSSSGIDKGWTLALQPNGSWTWNIGDGKNRLDYLPTPEFQPINDGQLHYLAFTVNFKERSVWLYYDGRNVAIYSLDELNQQFLQLNDFLGEVYSDDAIEIKTIEKRRGFLTPDKVLKNWEEKFPANPNTALTTKNKSLNVISWNIWHGGRRDGEKEGLERTIGILKDNRPDLICMQETYGSGPIIADHLQFIYYYRSSNLSVMSRYPITRTLGFYEPFRFGGVTVELPDSQQVNVFSLWINHLPGVNEMVHAAKDQNDIIPEEMKTRGKEIQEIIATLPDLLEERDSVPIIVGGDFNSPSHLDWKDNTASIHLGLTVEWPVSKFMAEAGFKDGFRTVHSDPMKHYGRTWSPKFTEVWQDRIDYIYYSGEKLDCVDAKMLDQWDPQWPSDHAGVWCQFELK